MPLEEADLDRAVVELIAYADLLPEGKVWLRDGRSGARLDLSGDGRLGCTCSSSATWWTTRFTPAPSGHTRSLPNNRWLARRSSVVQRLRRDGGLGTRGVRRVSHAS